MKLTKFGQFIRKYRIEKGLYLKDMAKDLDVSSSFLSAVEFGRKAIPTNFLQNLSAKYSFSEDEKKELLRAIDESSKQISIEMPTNSLDRQLIGAFCRNFESLDEETKKQLIKQLLD